MAAPLLGEDFLKRLRRLALRARRARVRREGEHRTRRLRGGFVEFSDHRRYVAGDEFRAIDWNLAARLGQFFVKQFARDESLRVALLVDGSASMGIGDPTKGEAARRIAAAVGAIALLSGNRVRAAVFADGEAREGPELASAAAVPRLLDFLGGAPAGTGTRLEAVLSGWRRAHPRPSLLLLFTDLMDQEGARRALAALAGRGFDLGVVQVLAPEEAAPDLRRLKRVRSVETGEEEEVRFGEGAAAEYAGLLDAWIRDWGRAIRDAGGRHLVVRSDGPIEGIVLRVLREEGWLK